MSTGQMGRLAIVTYVLLLVSFVLLLFGAFIFTNAVEWLGQRLNLGSGAVGSILAAVATALPESVVPVVAIIAGGQSGEIAIGAILGAPFLLGTLAMAIVGLAALGWAGRREQGRELTLHRETTRRDLTVFLVFFAVAMLLGVVGTPIIKDAAAVVFVIAYGTYVWLTVRRGGQSGDTAEMSRLYFDRSRSSPRTVLVALQALAGIAAIVGGAHLFVTEIEHIASTLGVSALVLALVIAPLATELPEKMNSLIWIHAGKDSLALGNITGAMVFQSMLPVAVGMAFTPWDFSTQALAASIAALIGGALVVVTLWRTSRFALGQVIAWLVLYVGTIVVITTATG